MFTQRTSAARGLCLDLFRHQREQQTGYWPFTPPVQACFALREALCELEETGGWMPRRRAIASGPSASVRCSPSWAAEMLLPADDFSSMITSFALPEGVEYAVLHDQLREAGFVIYAGLGRLSGRTFRIATMGEIRRKTWTAWIRRCEPCESRHGGKHRGHPGGRLGNTPRAARSAAPQGLSPAGRAADRRAVDPAAAPGRHEPHRDRDRSPV